MTKAAAGAKLKELTVDRRIDALDEKQSRYFVWLVGLQVTSLVAIVGALLTRS